MDLRMNVWLMIDVFYIVMMVIRGLVILLKLPTHLDLNSIVQASRSFESAFRSLYYFNLIGHLRACFHPTHFKVFHMEYTASKDVAARKA